jgi:enolase
VIEFSSNNKNMPKIKNIFAREILDSRGVPTLEAEVTLSDESFGRAAVPSGASTGAHEALELRDGGNRHKGKGVQKAVSNINSTISNKILNKELDQRSLDAEMIALDGTENKSSLGANAILAVSLAFAHAVAESTKVPLWKYFASISKKPLQTVMPRPMINILNGGLHGGNGLDFQEFMIVPKPGKTFSETLERGALVFHNLKSILKERNLSVGVGDEGGFAPTLKSNREALDLVMSAIEKAGFTPGSEIEIALDVASSTFYHDGRYLLSTESRTLNKNEMIDFYSDLVSEFPIISIEDPLEEDDFEGYKIMTEKLGKKIMVVGDDLFVTNKSRLDKGLAIKSANAILIKLNQIGSVTETIDVIDTAHENNYKAIISHRSGETEDTSIAHLAVGLGTGWIKTGSLSRSERMAKYNELLRISENLN